MLLLFLPGGPLVAYAKYKRNFPCGSTPTPNATERLQYRAQENHWPKLQLFWGTLLLLNRGLSPTTHAAVSRPENASWAFWVSPLPSSAVFLRLLPFFHPPPCSPKTVLRSAPIAARHSSDVIRPTHCYIAREGTESRLLNFFFFARARVYSVGPSGLAPEPRPPRA